MIPVYRHPYKDEHITGWLQDLADMNGLSFRQFCNTYMDGMAWDGAVDSVSGIDCLASYENPLELLYRCTLIPALAPFMTVAMQSSAVDRLLNGGQKHVFISCRYMQVCPDCMREDMENGITPYYRTWHQLKEISHCAVHGTRLLIIRKQGPLAGASDMVETEGDDKGIAEKIYALYRNPAETDCTAWHCALQKRERRVNRAYRIEHADLQWIQEAERSPIVAQIRCAVCGRMYLTHPYAEGRYNICHTCRRALGEEGTEQTMISLRKDYAVAGNEIIHIKCGKKMTRCSVRAFLWNGRECGCLAKKGSLEIHKDRIDDEEFTVTEYIKDARRGVRKVKIRHKTCGKEFVVRAGDFIAHRYCRVCGRYSEKFTANIRDMTGDEYEVLTPETEITGTRSSVMLRHDYCGTVFSNTARNITEGQRCPFCQAKLGPEKVIGMLRDCFNMEGYSVNKEGGYIRVTFPDGNSRRIRPAEALQEMTRLDTPGMFGTRIKKIGQPVSPKARLYVHYRACCDPKGMFHASAEEMRSLGMKDYEYWSGIQYLLEQNKVEKVSRGQYRIL